MTPAEMNVLSIIYQLGEADIFEIQRHTASEKDWKYTTIQTITNHLYEKHYLSRSKVGRRYIYKPALPRSIAFKIFIEKFFGKSLADDPTPIVDYLLSIRKLSKEEEDKIRSLFR